MSAALHIALTGAGPRIAPPAPPALEALLLHRRVEEAALLVPRIFNLCRAAQSLGARVALGLPARPEDRAALADEILRDHLMRFFVLWPRALGLPPAPLPGDDIARAVFGPPGRCPAPDAFDRWLVAGAGVAPVLAALAGRFAPGEAVADLPPADPGPALDAAAEENSPWLRHRTSPLLAEIEARYGRGPLWRAAARLVDLEACLSGQFPATPATRGGVVRVPAARGTYSLSARVEDGRVAAFRRLTPTDHLCARGGVLQRALESLPRGRADLAPLVVDILDPCVPVVFDEAAHA
ncbi:hydrogenase expression/formation protein HupK [Rhodovulum visakhapatnamense]|uniref:Hydrogenase expression/formation protein HupK n=1 Tax=Rhodovulum visakhapatnamense TaxID=364297 RepID=A0A4R8G7J4_9RHOB|nr:hydrogenase expression/formation protein HupK [Rhodovulum visakhapatnamense]TDX31348.1 hypothetical protein EV657_105196 [Rhodovulum visakhapatnamense]